MLLLLLVFTSLLSAQMEYRATASQAVFVTPTVSPACVLQASLSAAMQDPVTAQSDPGGTRYQLDNLQPSQRYFVQLLCDGRLADATIVTTEPDSPPAPSPDHPCEAADPREIAASAEGELLDLPVNPACGQSLRRQGSWLRFQPHASRAHLVVDPNPGAARQTSVYIGSETVTIRQAASSSCAFQLGSSWYPGTAGTYTMTVPAPPGCTWSVAATPNWVTISGPSSGTGPGQFTYTLSTNGGTLRSGVLTLSGGQNFQLNQMPGTCLGSGANTSWFPTSGGTYSFDLIAPAGCSWTLTTTASWIRIHSALAGSGAATVSYTIDPNTGLSRSASLVATFAGGTVTRTIQQPVYIYSGTCTFTFASPSYNLSAAAQTQTVSIVTQAGCPWTLVSNTTWAVPAVTSGLGSADVAVQVAANTTMNTRIALLTIAGQTMTLSQAGAPCNPTFAASGSYFPHTAGTYALQVNAPEGCPWNATFRPFLQDGRPNPWAPAFVEIVGGPMSGTGLLSFKLAANADPRRTGYLLLGQSWYNIIQMGDPCAVTFFPIDTWLPSYYATYSVSVITGPNCPWTVTSNVPWIEVHTPAGVGSGRVWFTSQPNSGAVRTAQLSSGVAYFPIRQVGGQ
ncbi:MAG: BACON domain-containing protein [Bryobacterales bacterium]|nr:BACON domain-containing protein [Bryobacterales bacterium]